MLRHHARLRSLLRSLLLSLLLLLLLAGSAVAQSLHFYIVPQIGSGQAGDSRRPKYIGDMVGVTYSNMEFGHNRTVLVGAIVSDTQHLSIAVNLDAVVFPVDLDQPIGLAGRDTVRTRIEQVRVPGLWIETPDTYRQVIGFTGRVFMLLQRFTGYTIGPRFFDEATTLDSPMRDLSVRSEFLAAMASLGLNTTGVRLGTSIRDALTILAAQMPSFSLMGQTF